MKLPKPSKKFTALATVTVLGVIGGGTALLTPSHATATETTPLVEQVDAQQKQLENHETRITGLENGTPTSTPTGTTTSTPVSAPATTSNPSPAPAPAPQPKTAVSYKQVPADGQNINCLVTYNDGTSELLPWKSYSTASNGWPVEQETGSCPS